MVETISTSSALSQGEECACVSSAREKTNRARWEHQPHNEDEVQHHQSHTANAQSTSLPPVEATSLGISLCRHLSNKKRGKVLLLFSGWSLYLKTVKMGFQSSPIQSQAKALKHKQRQQREEKSSAYLEAVLANRSSTAPSQDQPLFLMKHQVSKYSQHQQESKSESDKQCYVYITITP